MRYITPEHCVKNRLGERAAPEWAAALLVFRDHPHSKAVLDAFGPVKPVQRRLLYNLTSEDHEPFVFEATVAGKTVVIVTRCVWGGPQCAILVEELACLGVPTIIGYGVAGSMDPALPQGALVVADAALPTDGTSRAYGATDTEPADAALVEAVREIEGEMCPVTAVTVDALYRETHEYMEDLRQQGGQIVNLETSPLYAAARVCSVRSVWLGYISDCLVEGDWHDWFRPMPDAAEATVRVCRELIGRVIIQGDSTCR